MIKSSAITTAVREARVRGLRGPVTVWLAAADWRQVLVTAGESPEPGAESVGVYDPGLRVCFARQCQRLAGAGSQIIKAREGLSVMDRITRRRVYEINIAAHHGLLETTWHDRSWVRCILLRELFSDWDSDKRSDLVLLHHEITARGTLRLVVSHPTFEQQPALTEPTPTWVIREDAKALGARLEARE